MRRAFTLVELLVVVAVIATLAGVLLPALAGARAEARRAAGASNIRQLQLANTVYAGEHDGRFLPAAVDIFPRANIRERENTHRWHGTRERPSGPFDPGGGPITPYLESAGASRAVRACPSFAPRLEELAASGEGFESGCGGYGYNAAFVGARRQRDHAGKWVLTARAGAIVGDDAGSRDSRFRRPDATVAFADAALSLGGSLIEYSFAEPPVWPHLPDFSPHPSVHFRHRGRANAAWLDGHVTSERRTRAADAPIILASDADTGLGWFGDAHANTLFDYE
jgi:prepilin-type processing-associated H-X9-DG protein/prepilin-type N-terminal cleavage/methylation domain-containing protein